MRSLPRASARGKGTRQRRARIAAVVLGPRPPSDRAGPLDAPRDTLDAMALKDSYSAETPDRLTQSESEPPFSWRAALEIIQALALAVIISVVLNLFVVQVTE